MIRRETDAVLANAISNMEGVLTNGPYDEGKQIDWSPVVEKCIILSNGEDAIQVYEPKEGRYNWELITIFAPTCRGKRAVETGLAMREWMRPYTNMIFGSVPNSLPQAQWFYRRLGGYPVERVVIGPHIYLANEGETLFEFRVSHELQEAA